MLHGGASVDRRREAGPSQRRYRSMQDLTLHGPRRCLHPWPLPFEQWTLPPERRGNVVHQ